jgi:hypothetical protein
MLLYGVINELKKLTADTGNLSFFFYQATKLQINNATAVLHDLKYLLVVQQPSLISYVRKKYDDVSESLFSDQNT